MPRLGALCALVVLALGLSAVAAPGDSTLRTPAASAAGADAVWAWGDNSLGVLGDGTTTNRSTPVQVAGPTGITALAAGWDHSLALGAAAIP